MRKVEGRILDQKYECMSREKLEELQERRLRRIVNYCYEKVPLYREKFRKAGIAPDGIRTIDDLAKAPFTVKDDLRRTWPYEMLATDMRNVATLHCSSGTTGTPTLAPFTRKDIDTWGRCMARGLAMMGVEEGDVLQNAYGYGLFTGGLGFHYGALEIGAVVVPMSGGQTARQIQLAMDLKAKYICATPSYAAHLGEYAKNEMGLEPEEIPWLAGPIGAEPFTDKMRRRIEDLLDMEVFDTYGLSEITGPGVAYECGEHDGDHFFEDMWIPEVIDPKTEERLDEGKEGELVLTHLSKEAMPLLRFRTGDITSLIEEKCGCGRTIVRTGPDRFVSRVDDMLKIKGVKLWPSTIEDAIVSVKGASENWRAIVERPKDVDMFRVEVEPTKEEYNRVNGDLSRLEGLRKKIGQSVKNVTMVSAKVGLKHYGELERFTGKGLSEKVVDKRKEVAF